MTATLTFNLPEDATEHLVAVRSPEMADAILCLSESLRHWTKHGHQFKTPEEVIDSVREMISEARAIAECRL